METKEPIENDYEEGEANSDDEEEGIEEGIDISKETFSSDSDDEEDSQDERAEMTEADLKFIADDDDEEDILKARDYIGSKVYHPNYRQEITNKLQSSTLKTIEKLAIKQHKEIGKKSINSYRKELIKLSNRIIDVMVADLSSETVVKMFGFTVRNLLTRLYHRGIHIDEEEVSALRVVAKEAAEKKQSLVFLPSHKSHIDYLVVSYVLYRMGIAIPHIAAGDNLNMPFLGSILRSNGAFFIRREWGGDKLYIAIMKTYIDIMLSEGYNIEAFVEGTRSRTGKLLQPKFGFIKLILESMFAYPTRDCIIVPVNIGYDKVIETPSYITELLGTPKQKESIFQLLNSVNLLQLKWGRVDVRFGQSFSLQKYIQSVLSKKTAGKMNLEQKKTSVLQSFGFKILGDVNNISVIMPTALVGTVLLTLRGRGVGKNELIRRVNWLKKEIDLKGGQTAEGQSSTAVIVERALEVLKDLIGIRFDILEPVYYPLKRFELSYYRNQLIHLFVSESILSAVMYATIKAGGPIQSQKISIKGKLYSDCEFLSRLMKFEFVYGPGGLLNNMEQTIDGMVKSNVVIVELDPKTNEEMITLSAEERRTGRETFDFYCFLIWPFVETYWLTAVSLYTILPNIEDSGKKLLHWFDLKVFINRAQVFGKTLYYEGDVSYYEAVGKETIANAIIRLKEMGLVRIHKGQSPPSDSKYEPSDYSTNANTSWIALNLDWVPAEKLPEHLITIRTKEAPKKDWFGPLGNFSTVKTKSIFDETSSIALRQMPEAESGEDFRYYGNDTKDIERLYKTSTKSIKPMEILPHDETDIGFDSWSKHRPSGRLWDFCEHIGSFRREGKNRRDTSTVANRVLRLARFASHWRAGKIQIPLNKTTANL